MEFMPTAAKLLKGSKIMQVILLERVEKLGQMGDVVSVKNGYARNFLLPQKKALRATSANQEKFDIQRSQLEARNLERGQEAQSVGEKLEGQSFVILRQASESGQLYGSVTTRDIALLISESGFSVDRAQINLNHPIKTINLHTTRVILHPEVSVNVVINVARTAEEAERQARGEAVAEEKGLGDDDQDSISAEDVFETQELAEAATEDLTEPSDSEGATPTDTSETGPETVNT